MIRCLAYRALFRFKQTALAGKLFFKGGQPFTVLARNVTVQGVVVDLPESETDGDLTFDICPYTAYRGHAQLHCEVTPCTRAAFKGVSLAIGDHVEVSGDFCYDPPHLGVGEHWEIHPVKSIRVLQAAGPTKAA